MYIKWDSASVAPVGVPSNVPQDDGGQWLPCRIPPQPRASEAQTLVWEYHEEADGAYVSARWEGSSDPLDAPASNFQKNEWFERKKLEPIEVFGVMVDCDLNSEKLLQETIDTWDFRVPDGEWFTDIEVDGELVRVIYWKDANNVLQALNRVQATAFYDQMRINRAVRGQALWADLQRFKSAGCTLRDLL